MKKSVKQLLSLFFALAMLFVITSCNDDETTPVPTISAPGAQSVAFGGSTTLSFAITAPGGYASAAATAINGTATITAEPTIGATTGTIEVSFTAGTTAGAAGVTVAITDAKAQVTNATAVITVESQITTVTVTSNISTNTTWETGKTYILASRITVIDGITLTIQPGVVVKGQAGSGANATALLVARGGKLMAEGTAASPIIFTSIADELEPGMIASPNLAPTDNGLWGGLIVLGKAPISADAEAIQIEGIPPSDTNGLYGGTVANDNSGVIRYVSIRHGGTNIGDGNEINGLTLGGVGSGTTVEFIEVIGNKDDGIEIFGGTVNPKHVLIWNSGDDSFDMDQAWSGTLDNFIGIQGPESDHALELDGPEGAGTGSFTLKNGSIKGDLVTAAGEYADLRDGVTCTLQNIYFFNFKANADFELDNAGVSANFTAGTISFSALQFNVSHLTTGNITLDAIFKDDGGADAAFNTAASTFASIVTTPTVGADKTQFATWSWASVANQLTDF